MRDIPSDRRTAAEAALRRCVAPEAPGSLRCPRGGAGRRQVHSPGDRAHDGKVEGRGWGCYNFERVPRHFSCPGKRS